VLTSGAPELEAGLYRPMFDGASGARIVGGLPAF
jgi:hypothetical protein